MDASTRTIDKPRIRYGVLLAAMVVVAAVMIGMIVVLGRPSDEPATRAFVASDLGAIVLTAADAPTGTEPSISGHGRVILRNPVWYLPADEQQPFMNLAGFVDAREQSFEGPMSGGNLLFVSEAFLFEDASTAQAAIDAFSAEWQVSFGFPDSEPRPVDMGDGGVLFAGPATVQNGEPGFYYFWRRDNLVLNVAGIGDVRGEALADLEAATEAVALDMDRRAAARVE